MSGHQSDKPKPPHPGKIAYYDGDKLLETVNASDVSEYGRYAPTESGWVPIVKVVRVTDGTTFYIHEHGPGGGVVRSTVQVPKKQLGERRKTS